MKNILLAIFILFSALSYSQGNFQYTITNSCNTSAGVYNAAGVLIRTIWSVKPHTLGIHIGYWDGKDDFGVTATGGPFTVKVLSSNTAYVWEGIIGNTSDSLTGSTVIRTTAPITAMASVGSYIYSSLGYCEGRPSSWKTLTTNLNQKTLVPPGTTGSFENDYVCTDGTTVYWGALDPFNTIHTFVFGTKCSDDSYQTFSSGVSVPQTFAPTYNSCIGYLSASGTASLSYITGMAVQKTHNFLFISRSGINQLLILNKTTGAVVQTYTITGAGKLCVDPLDNLWLAHGTVIEKYSVNTSTGAIATTGITITLSNVGSVSACPDGTTIAAADMTNQQVKGYSTLDGSSKWTLGTGVSYVTNASVANNKFYWTDVRGSYATFLCYLPDSSLMIGDGQNCRTQRFNYARTFVESQSYMGNSYYVYVDPNNTSKAFAMFLEFAIDYTKPLRTGWTLVNNWGGNYGSGYDVGTRVIY